MDENPSVKESPEKTPAPNADSAARRSIRERAYDWLYDHHVTVKVMDLVIAVLLIGFIVIVVLGMNR